jgi:hypothetical protein
MFAISHPGFREQLERKAQAMGAEPSTEVALHIEVPQRLRQVVIGREFSGPWIYHTPRLLHLSFHRHRELLSAYEIVPALITRTIALM